MAVMIKTRLRLYGHANRDAMEDICQGKWKEQKLQVHQINYNSLSVSGHYE